jgi:hypothetical protein
MVSFVVTGREAIVERGCLQLWIPKQLEGNFIKNSDAASQMQSGSVMPSRSPSTVTTSTFSPLPIPTSPVRGGFFDSVDPFRRTTPDNSPTRGNNFRRGSQSPTHASQRRPGPEFDPSAFSTSPTGRRPTICLPPTSPRAGGGFWSSSPPPQADFPPTPPRGSGVNLQTTGPSGRVERTESISTYVSVGATSTVTNSSSSDKNTMTLDVGAGTTGYLHRRPDKPMLVFFTQNQTDGRFNLITIGIDEETNVNLERCNCRGSSCFFAVLEEKEGNLSLDARRFESKNGDTDWNVARLAHSKREERDYQNAAWKNICRISIMFPDPAARIKFAGPQRRCQCRVVTERELNGCLKAGHQGLLGEVKEIYRRQCTEYHENRYNKLQDVVKGRSED